MNSEELKNNAKTSGQIYTPKFIVQNILDTSGYYDKAILRKHVIDNSCGDGAFLSEIVTRYCEVASKEYNSLELLKIDLENYIHGIEINKSECKKCIERLNDIVLNYGINNVSWDINCADSLTITKYDGKMDYVLGNPPYVRVHNLGDNFDRIKSFSFAQGGMTDLYIVFFEIGIKMLNPTGVLGYITPSSYFNSLAGCHLRKYLTDNNLIDKIIDLQHFQAFSATTYTTITILKKIKKDTHVNYYRYDEKNFIPYYVDCIKASEFSIAGNFYFGYKSDLILLKQIFNNKKHSDVMVKNGYATLCDKVFINDFKFKSNYLIPVIKASTGNYHKLFYPYDKNGRLISENIIAEDKDLYSYLLNNKATLQKSNKDNGTDWYSFGRSQAINDTYKNKLAINALIRNANDLKIKYAPSGTGVYSGLYIISETIDFKIIIKTLKTDEFASYISLLGKYKSGGYYTFSSKDVKAYLDYKLSF